MNVSTNTFIRGEKTRAIIIVVVFFLKEQKPCEHPNAISLPRDKKCLVPVATASSWIDASRICESAGGSLYEVLMHELSID